MSNKSQPEKKDMIKNNNRNHQKNYHHPVPIPIKSQTRNYAVANMNDGPSDNYREQNVQNLSMD
jgi:hypothetical protein